MQHLLQRNEHLRLRLEVLIGQSKVLGDTKSPSQHDDSTFDEYFIIRLGVIHSKIEELMWVLNEKDVSSAFFDLLICFLQVFSMSAFKIPQKKIIP
jgi:hypothetical protein